MLRNYIGLKKHILLDVQLQNGRILVGQQQQQQQLQKKMNWKKKSYNIKVAGYISFRNNGYSSSRHSLQQKRWQQGQQQQQLAPAAAAAAAINTCYNKN